MPDVMAKRLSICVLACSLAVAAAAQQQQQQSKTKPPDTAPTPPGAFVVGATQTVNPNTSAGTPPAAVPAPAVKKLADPSADQIQNIINAFTTNEKAFRELLNKYYIYDESILAQELDDNGTPNGAYQQEDEIQEPPGGDREIICTFCPVSTIKDITITQEDITDMFNMNAFTVSVEQLPQYNITYVDHEPLDEVTAYVFNITPKEIVKGQRYFQGKVWVDDKDLMIVKSQGKVVPDEVDKHGVPTNTFLPFTVYRQKIDNKYWFPVYTLMQGSIPGGPGVPPIPMRMVLQFKNYKQVHVDTRIIVIRALPDGSAPPVKPGGGGGGGGLIPR